MKRLWLDLGDFRSLLDPQFHSHEKWQDGGGGLTGSRWGALSASGNAVAAWSSLTRIRRSTACE